MLGAQHKGSVPAAAPCLPSPRFSRRCWHTSGPTAASCALPPAPNHPTPRPEGWRPSSGHHRDAVVAFSPAGPSIPSLAYGCSFGPNPCCELCFKLCNVCPSNRTLMLQSPRLHPAVLFCRPRAGSRLSARVLPAPAGLVLST